MKSEFKGWQRALQNALLIVLKAWHVRYGVQVTGGHTFWEERDLRRGDRDFLLFEEHVVYHISFKLSQTAYTVAQTHREKMSLECTLWSAFLTEEVTVSFLPW